MKQPLTQSTCTSEKIASSTYHDIARTSNSSAGPSVPAGPNADAHATQPLEDAGVQDRVDMSADMATAHDGEGITHIAALVPDPHNRRQHNPRNVAMIVDSIQQTGAGRSIVIDEDGVILCGNATVDAAA